MSHPPKRIHSLPVLLLVLVTIFSTQNASARPAAVTAPARPAAPASLPALSSARAAAPDFTVCNGGNVITPCTNLQVFLLIDDSGSMLYSDPYSQRIAGVRNVLDILAKVYYLPAVEAHARDARIRLPNIQVALIHFGEKVLHDSGWKMIAPASLDEWTSQLKDLQPDLEAHADALHPQNTDFRPAFQAAADLSKSAQTPDCPRLVMLFTDGMPDYGKGPLAGTVLALYMQELQGIIWQTFNPGNDRLFLTAFVSDNSVSGNWNSTYKQAWEDITKDSQGLDPRRVLSVLARELPARMERIIAATIGAQVDALIPVAGNPRQFATEIPILVDSLRLTYYTINSAASFTVTGPDNKVIKPDGSTVVLSGAGTSIQALEIFQPSPGAYLVNTSVPGGQVTQLLRFEQISAQFFPPMGTWLQYTNRQIGIQLLEPDGKPLAVTPEMSMRVTLKQAGSSQDFNTTPGSEVFFTTGWMPISTQKAAVGACAVVTDSQGKSLVLYNGPVGEISVDPLTVQAGTADQVCALTGGETSLPLQLINGRSGQPVAIEAPVLWSSSSPSGRTNQAGSISEIDASSGKYALRYRPASTQPVKFAVTARADIQGVKQPFFNGMLSSSGLQPPRPLQLSLGTARTAGDRLSVMLYKWFHPICLDEHTQVLIGRHFFGLFGPSRVQISGRFTDAASRAGEPGMERFTVQLVSTSGGQSSEMLSSWQSSQNSPGFSRLDFRSPGLGLYTVVVNGKKTGPGCAALTGLPSQSVLLINDFWEYLAWLVLLLILILVVVLLARRRRNRRSSSGSEIPLILAAVVLLVLNIFLVRLLYTRTFKCQLNCSYLIDRTLNSDTLCSGVTIGPWTILPGFTLGPIRVPAVRFLGVTIIPGFTVGPVEIPDVNLGPFHPLPPLKGLDPPLESLRQLISRIILFLLLVSSLVLARIAGKIIGFIRFLMTSQGRTAVLTSLGFWLFFFVLFCSLFWFGR